MATTKRDYLLCEAAINVLKHSNYFFEPSVAFQNQFVCQDLAIELKMGHLK